MIDPTQGKGRYADKSQSKVITASWDGLIKLWT